MNNAIFDTAKSMMPEMVATLSELCAIPAISPQIGGQGEYKKAQYLVKKVEELGFGKAEVVNCPDPEAENGVRPSVIVRIPGKTKKRLWFIAHMDVVPAGDVSLWNTDPFKAVVKDGYIYGRGVNDNSQEIVTTLYAALALKKLGITPQYETCLCFVADEEVGSKYGIQYLIKQNLFTPDDLILVPDGGSDDGGFIQIAEKYIVWAEFEIKGRQVHACTPQLGINACRAANDFSYVLDCVLHDSFPQKDELFDPPVSTFEPTRRSANVPNFNTVPGREVLCFDCRMLPSIPPEKLVAVMDKETARIEAKYGVKITRKFAQFVEDGHAPAPTPTDAPLICLLKKAMKEVMPVEPRVGGVGGGTCAAYFRGKNIPAVVWGQSVDCAHMPNERASLEHMEHEIKVFALMMQG